MRRLSLAIAALFLGCIFSGCGEDQPNAPAQPAEVNTDFVKKTTDMMKDANKGMDIKSGKSKGAQK
ncbi:MAG: hypothetical protein ACLQIB_24840 [Isosphaeraceae bacterium]